MTDHFNFDSLIPPRLRRAEFTGPLSGKKLNLLSQPSPRPPPVTPLLETETIRVLSHIYRGGQRAYYSYSLHITTRLLDQTSAISDYRIIYISAERKKHVIKQKSCDDAG